MRPIRVAGVLLCVVGLVLTFVPTLVYDPGPAADLFETIERRIPWGGVLGLGMLLFLHRRLQPWAGTITATVVWLTAGLLFARVVGLALDGFDSPRQWTWTAVEAVILAVAVFFHRRIAARER